MGRPLPKFRICLSYFPRSDDGVDMNRYGVFYAAGVTAGKRRCDGNVARAYSFEYLAIPRLQSFRAERKTSQLVFAIRIGSTDVKNHVRTKFIQASLNRGNQCI